jgi:hypothetical protein
LAQSKRSDFVPGVETIEQQAYALLMEYPCRDAASLTLTLGQRIEHQQHKKFMGRCHFVSFDNVSGT